MDEQLDEVLARVAEEVFEALVFMFPVEEEEADENEARAETTVRVTFNGPISGALLVAVPVEMLPVLSTNMLGIDYEGPPRPDGEDDALKELANVICGNLLPVIAGAEAVFRVHAPEVVERGLAVETGRGLAPTARASLTLDEGKAEVSLFVDRWNREARNDPPDRRRGMIAPHSRRRRSAAKARRRAAARTRRIRQRGLPT